MNAIEELIKLAPCTVLFMPNVSWPKGWKKSVGLYHVSEHTTHGQYIAIQADVTTDKKLGALAHETGHALCGVKNCRCGLGNSEEVDVPLAEYHANKFALSWLLKHKCKEALKFNMGTIRAQATWGRQNSVYVWGAKKIMKLKLWQKCVDFVGEEK